MAVTNMSTDPKKLTEVEISSEKATD